MANKKELQKIALLKESAKAARPGFEQTESGLAHLLLESGFFQPEFYLRQYPDVAASELDPVLHYARHGWAEARLPGEWADQENLVTMLAANAGLAKEDFWQFLEKWRDWEAPVAPAPSEKPAPPPPQYRKKRGRKQNKNLAPGIDPCVL